MPNDMIPDTTKPGEFPTKAIYVGRGYMPGNYERARDEWYAARGRPVPTDLMVSDVPAALSGKKRFVKVTNTRGGEFNLHAAGLVLEPGTTYHGESVFHELATKHPNILESLKLHESAGELRFEFVEVDDAGQLPKRPAYKSALPLYVPDAPAPPVPELPPNGAPALSTDPAVAMQQIEAEQNPAVLDHWFGQVKDFPELSDAIVNRAALVSPA